MSKRELMRKHYCETLLQMCEDQPLSTITVTALIKRADTAKQTFYNNFRDLNDLINYIPRTYMMLMGFRCFSPNYKETDPRVFFDHFSRKPLSRIHDGIHRLKVFCGRQSLRHCHASFHAFSSKNALQFFIFTYKCYFHKTFPRFLCFATTIYSFLLDGLIITQECC